jgi:sulfopropanediol 3-dehydrogenase
MPIALKSPAASSGGGADSLEAVRMTVEQLIAQVRVDGDAAVRELSARFDGWAPAAFRLSPEEIERTVASVPAAVLDDIRWCQRQVRTFALAQLRTISDLDVETQPGVRLGHRNIPIDSVGAYVPGGRYPMVASAHMSVLTAKVAGVRRVVACTPPLNGAPPAATVAAMHLAGADEILVLGGVQAIAAMALGTASIDPVDMLVGPGNAYVAEAKRQLFGAVGIDLTAGPSEILVIADETADAELVATDLLSQAEHGPTSEAVLITSSRALGEAVVAAVARQLETLPTADVAAAAWDDYGQVLLVGDDEHAAALADELAIEHVEVHTRDPLWYRDRLRNYGSLFLGEHTTVAFGDKAIGTNHILPTSRAARYTGGLWVGKFMRTVTWQTCTVDGGARVGAVAARQSRLENFEGHALACDARANALADPLEA